MIKIICSNKFEVINGTTPYYSLNLQDECVSVWGEEHTLSVYNELQSTIITDTFKVNLITGTNGQNSER